MTKKKPGTLYYSDQEPKAMYTPCTASMPSYKYNKSRQKYTRTNNLPREHFSRCAAVYYAK